VGFGPRLGVPTKLLFGFILLRETLDNLNQWKIKAKTGL
jgi:hypothetical protein